jgi:hypothetical protein
MDEGTGSTTKDDAASNTGTITGATWKSESDGCPSGNCLYFDGDDRITTSAFALSGTVITASGWVKTTFSVSIIQSIIAEGSTSATIGYLWMYRGANSDNVLWRYADGASASRYANLSNFFTGYDNTWVHFAVVADYSGTYPVKFYRNGELIQTTTMSNGTPIFPSTSRAKYLGSYGTSYPITNGNLDDIRIYNRELSAAEIKALYEGTK